MTPAALLLASFAGSAHAEFCGHAVSAYSLRNLLRPTPPPLMRAAETDVLRNDLQIEAHPPGGSVSGSNTLTVEALADLNSFVFRLSNNFTIASLKLDGRPITFTRLDSANVRANFDQTVPSGAEFQLFIDYFGDATSGSGFGSYEYGTRSNGQPYVFTLSEPWYAYTWWPGKDDNTDKAINSIAVTIPSTMVVAANGTLQGIDDLPSGRRRYRWASDYPMSDYLVSFAAANYNTWDRTFNGMPVQFFIYPENDTTGNRAGWDRSIDMLALFGKYYGQYPFTTDKYGIYQFGFGGGMEHQTITGQGGFSESLTSHELAHQWWGDMVTCADWPNIWLNEGFATYSEAVWLEKKPGSTGLSALKAAMQARRPSSFSEAAYRYNASSVGSIFNSNYAYRKGGWALHMLRYVVGDKTFFLALSSYRQHFQYKTATTEDLRAIFEGVSGKDLGWFFEEWVYEPGAPSYQWGWTTTTADGEPYLLVHLQQTQSASYPTYRMPIALRSIVAGARVQWILDNFAREQHYVFPITDPPSAPVFDPDGWILTQSTTNETYVPGPPKVVKVVAFKNAKGLIDRLEVTFHTGVAVTAADFELLISTGRSIPFDLTYDAARKTAVLQLQKASGGSYSLRVRDTIHALNSGKALDGEVGTSPSLPSGDGVPGGDLVMSITP